MVEKIVCLVSGGIDSPVACALLAKRFEVLPLHFCIYPYTREDSFLTAMEVLKRLKLKTGLEKAVVIPWAGVLRTILGRREWVNYTCLACRWGMLKAAELLCEREGAAGIATGESLGQKATQTLTNLGVSSHGIKFPILRPLLGFDKLEIERLSKELGIWHEVHAGCCYATPRYPRTRAKPEVLDEMSRELRIERVIEEQFTHMLEVRTFEEDFRGYLKTLV